MTDQSRLVTVNCPSHSELLIDGLWNFFVSKYRVDVDVPWGGGSVGAHQLILDLFLPPENLIVRGALTDHRCHLEAVLEFMYKGTVCVGEEQLDNLLQVANQLDFKMLVDAVELTRKSETQRLTRRQRKGSHPSKFVPKYDESSEPDDDETKPPPLLGARRRGSARGRRRGRPRHDSEVIGQLIPVKTESTTATLVTDADPSIELSEEAASLVLVDEDTYFVQQEVPATDDAVVVDGGGAVRPTSKTKTVRLKKYVCETCGFRTKAPSNLVLHRRCHTGEKPFQCNSCDKSFADPSTWRRHLRRHLSDDKPYACLVCKKAFRRPDNLKAHLKTGHKRVKTIHCRVCPYSSTVKGEVSEHVKVAHPDIKADKAIALRRCTCETCGFSTETMAVLKRHQLRHSGEKPFVCHVCGLAYSDRTTLRRHVQRHLTDEKCFVCHLCGKSFYRRDNLNAHLKNVHKSSAGKAVPPPAVATTTEELEQAQLV